MTPQHARGSRHHTGSFRSTQQPALTIANPGELADVIPYLLGFHPQASVVLVGLHDRSVVVTARIDLAELDIRATKELLEILSRNSCQSVVLALYDECSSAPRLPHSDIIAQLTQACDAETIHVVEALLVSGDRFYSYLCEGSECCPSEGQPLQRQTSVAVAAATYAGMVALDSREEVGRLLEPYENQVRDLLEPHLAQAENEMMKASLDDALGKFRRYWLRRLKNWDENIACGTAELADLAPDEIAGMLVAIAETSIRDEIWLLIDAERIQSDPLWIELARRAPAPYDAAPLFLLAWSRWRAGNGTLARCALERALLSDPGYTAATLLLSALDQGLNPHQTPRLDEREYRRRVVSGKSESSHDDRSVGEAQAS